MCRHKSLLRKDKTQHEAISFLEEHGVPTFVPVFETVESIEPKSNESLRGQVPWKCAFCHNHSFGHHCQGCVRHRDAAALRIFVGQLCKEGTQDVVSKMVEVLCPDLSAPAIFVEPHTDANTGRGKGCAWIYVHTLEDIPYVVKCLNKRTFVTVDENSGNVGFVAFPSSFSNSEIEEAFQIDHDAQTPELQSLFLFTCIAAQVPKAFHSWGLLKNHNNNNNMNMNNKKFVPRNQQYIPRVQQQQQQQQQQVLPPPPPPTYGSSLPPPPTFSPVTKNTTSSNNNQTVVVDNRQYEEQQQQYEQMLMKPKQQQQQQQQQNVLMTKPSTTSPVSSSSSSSSSATPKVFLGNEPTASTHFTCPVPQSQQVHQASWVNDVQDDDNYFITRQQQQQHQQNHQHQRQVSSTSSSSVGHRYPQQQQQQRYQHYPYQY